MTNPIMLAHATTGKAPIERLSRAESSVPVAKTIAVMMPLTMLSTELPASADDSSWDSERAATSSDPHARPDPGRTVSLSNDQYKVRPGDRPRYQLGFVSLHRVTQVLAVGDCMIEACFVLPAKDDHAPDIALEACTFTCGGSAANFACTMGRIGEPTALLSHVGTDMFSTMLLDDLIAHRVDTRLVSSVTGQSSVTAIIIEPGGERRFLSFRSPAEPDPASTDPAEALQGIDWLHISGFVFQRPSTAMRARRLMETACQQGIPVSCDPSPLLSQYAHPSDREFWASFDVLFPNEYEATALTGQENMVEAARCLRDMGVRTVAITLGPAGCLVATEAGIQTHTAPEVPSVLDTTGAGDAFAAGFITGRRHALDVAGCATLGHLLASHAISIIGGHGGAQPAHALLREPMPAEVLSLVRKLAQSGAIDNDKEVESP